MRSVRPRELNVSSRSNPDVLRVGVQRDEIDTIDPRQFTIATMPARYAELGDLHQGIDDTPCRLDTLLEWANRDHLG
jgi:DNA primase